MDVYQSTDQDCLRLARVDVLIDFNSGSWRLFMN